MRKTISLLIVSQGFVLRDDWGAKSYSAVVRGFGRMDDVSENTSEGAKFLTDKYQNLYKEKPVLKATELHARREGVHPDSLKKEERVDSYMQRLERLFVEPDRKRRERNINMVVEPLVESAVISEEDFPDRYFENEQRLARERGHGDVEITSEMKIEEVRIIQEDQKNSYKRWIEYLSSDVPYPTWFKYYALRSVTKLQPYDKAKKEFPKRSKTTTKIFPEINREALTYVYESLTKDSPEDGLALRELIKSGNFSKFYSHAVEKQMHETVEAKEKRTSIDGEWVKYNEGSDHIPLFESIEGMGTGWCSAGEETAKTQLSAGDFHIFYSKDGEGNNTIPRIAVRMEHGRVAEVRGVDPSQELEFELIDTAREKFSTLPGGDKYETKVQNMKQMTEIERKNKAGEDLTQEELKFLYEVDEKIEGFGYSKDPRIREFKEIRDAREDYSIIFECSQSKVATSEDEVDDSTKIFVGNIDFKDFKKFPAALEVITISAFFRDSRIKSLGRLRSIGYGAIFTGSKIESLGGLEFIEGPANFYGSKVKDLGKLKSIGGDADFSESKVMNLGELQSIKGKAIFSESKITDLGKLESIGGTADFRNSQVEDLGKLKFIGWDADFRHSEISNLGDLKSIRRTVSFEDSMITDLRKLESIGGNADFRNSQVADLGKLESIGGNADFRNSQVADLGKLESIGLDADFRHSIVTNLDKLESIGRDAYFMDSQVEDLGVLKSIGGRAYFVESMIVDLGKLESIEVTLGENITIGYFAQKQTYLNYENNLLDHYLKDTHCPYGKAFGNLQKFLFKKDDLKKKVKNLSPGQRARFAFSIFAYNNYDFLILDEPTNHLDIETKEIIEQSLSNFKGTLLLVSHDRFFVEKIGITKIINLEEGKIENL